MSGNASQSGVRSDRESRAWFRLAAPWLIVAVVVVSDVWVFLRNPQDLDRLLINALLAFSSYATLHLKLLSLASAGFAAIGAYASAIFAVKLGLPLYLAMPAAALLGAAIAFVIGLPVLRLKDVYLAVATLGFGEIIRVTIILLPDLTGGSTGANLSTGFPYEAMKQGNSFVLAGTLLLLTWIFASTRKTKSGRALRAIRENPEAAATMGIDVVGYRLASFVASAAIAALAGAFYAHSVGSLDAGDFKFNRAVDILVYAVLGGSGTWFGPLLGAGFLTALPLFLRDNMAFLKDFAQLPNIVNGLALMLAIAFMPGGFASAFEGRGKKARRASRSPRKAAGPGGPGLPPDGIEDAEGSTEAMGSGRPGSATAAPLLRIEALGRRFGGVEALSGVGFEIGQGQICGLIGPNGAGKTTLINAITGVIPPSSGRIIFDGRDIAGLAPHKAAKAGIARSYQNIQLFGDMSVLDNVVVGRHLHMASRLPAAWLLLPGERREEAFAKAEALALLERLGLAELAEARASTLSYGDQRRVEIARALAQRPRLLLLDEPAAGMNEAETEKLGDFIATLKTHGYTILVVEHHMDLIMKICDTIVVLDFGKKIAAGRADEVARDPAVLEAYLGVE
ncbi:MAG TPA: branched-chain amino acid ABC transporter ATP-binding protein/permease [Rectinemataceae bacterium]|nr:branched-chain amino acid ABC transporter ATP-binding protein/permease [Rectinemataceae bacterium]